MRATLLVLGLVLAVGATGLADNGSVPWPIQPSGGASQPKYELCPPGTVYHCEEICVWWYQDVDPMCVNMCEFLWWWCPPCIQSCIAGCPSVWMCLQTTTVCSCVPDIPYGLDPAVY